MSAPKVVLVTGANKGIGYHIAKNILSAGYEVLLGCRSEERARAAIKKLQDEVPTAKAAAHFIPFDLEQAGESITCSSLDTTVAAVELVTQGRKLEAIVHNAGFAYTVDATEPFALQASRTCKINFFGTRNASERLLPFLKPGGRVVLLGSRAGYLSVIPSEEIRKKFTSPDLTVDSLSDLIADFVAKAQKDEHFEKGWPKTAYGVSKIGVNALAGVLAKSKAFQENGFTINSCCPGYCKTDMTTQQGMKSAESGADTPTWLAIDAQVEGVSGKFFGERKELDFAAGKW